jgi:hypothetical protein
LLLPYLKVCSLLLLPYSKPSTYPSYKYLYHNWSFFRL